jgi:hypothetical protein
MMTGDFVREVNSTDSANRSFSEGLCGFSNTANVNYDFQFCKLFPIEILNDFLNHSQPDATYFFFLPVDRKNPSTIDIVTRGRY